MEIGTNGAASPRGIRPVARDLESAGWDGLHVVDWARPASLSRS